MSVYIEEVIVAKNATAGDGKPTSPVRQIVEVYTKSGELIASSDPSSFSHEDVCAIIGWVRSFDKALEPWNTPDTLLRKWRSEQFQRDMNTVGFQSCQGSSTITQD